MFRSVVYLKTKVMPQPKDKNSTVEKEVMRSEGDLSQMLKKSC